MPVRSKREPWSSRRCISFLSFTSFGNNSSSFPLILERRSPLRGFAAMSPVSRYRRRKLRMNAKLTLMSGARGGHPNKCFWTWSEQTGSLFRSTRWDKGFYGCIWSLVDGGDSDPPFFKSVMDSWGWMIQVVLRPQQTQGFVLLKKRWGVEQTFGLLNWYRGLSKDDQFHDSAYGQAISLSWYPLPLFIQPLRLAVNYQINTSDCFMAHA